LTTGQQVANETLQIAREVRQLVGDRDTQRALKDTLRNVNEASSMLPRLANGFERLSRQGERVAVNLETASESAPRLARTAEALASDLQGTLRENRSSLQGIVNNLEETSSAIAGLTGQLDETLRDGTLRRNLLGVSDDLRSITRRLDTVTSNVERLSSDPRLAADLQATLANVRRASESIANVSSRVETIRIPGERRAPRDGGSDEPRRPIPPDARTLLEPGLVFDTVYDPDQDRARVDANFTYLATNGRFYRATLFDATYDNRLGLQLGQYAPDGRTALRYGLIRGKIGGGLDARAGLLDLRADLYDPNRLTLDLRARARLSESASALVGLEGAGSDNRATIGVQIRR
jgi:uncharacterized protein YoxC